MTKYLRVFDDFNLAMPEDGDAGVGRSQIDSDCRSSRHFGLFYSISMCNLFD
jgi:hypothetical protein